MHLSIRFQIWISDLAANGASVAYLSSSLCRIQVGMYGSLSIVFRASVRIEESLQIQFLKCKKLPVMWRMCISCSAFTFFCTDIVPKWEILKYDLQFLCFMYCWEVSIDQMLSSDLNIVSSIIVSSKLRGLYVVLNFYLSDSKMYLKK